MRPTAWTGRRTPLRIGLPRYNWGSAPMNSLINHCLGPRSGWRPYRGRLPTVIAEVRVRGLPIFMPRRDGTVVADDAAKVTFRAAGLLHGFDSGSLYWRHRYTA